MEKYTIKKTKPFFLRFYTLPILFSLAAFNTNAAIVTQHLNEAGLTKEDIVQELSGAGVTVSAMTYTGDERAVGIFSGAPSGLLGFTSGIVLSTGKISDLPGPNNASNRTTSFGLAGDGDAESLTTGITGDAAVLEFDFIPTVGKVKFSYVFSSEEYNEFSNSSFNDVFGFFVNGTNRALLPDGITVVSINTVNGGKPLGTNPQNPTYFVNNDCSAGAACNHAIQADGLTVKLTMLADVTPHVSNHFKIVIADVRDRIYDSWVVIEADSLTITEICNNGIDDDFDGLTDRFDDDCMVCRDGYLDLNEQCDDGNNINGDGCSDMCEIEDPAPVALCQPAMNSTDPGLCSSSAASIDNGSFDPDSQPITLMQTPAAPYPLGVSNVLLTVTDVIGQTATCNANVTVIDNELPSISCPADISIEAVGPGGSTVNFNVPAADNCSITTTSCDQTPGLFALGATLVNCQATDISTNQSLCQFNINVVDTTPPVLTVPGPIIQEANQTGGATVALPAVTASDVVDPSPVVSCDQSSGLFPLGVTTVNCTATDASGNSTPGSFTVTVVDTTPPVLTLPGDISVECNTTGGIPSSDSAIQAFVMAAIAVDIADPNPVVINNLPIFCPIGITTVTFVAEDASGNSSMGSANITVVDSTAPTVSAALVRVSGGDDDNDDDDGRFKVVYSCSDACDASVSTSTATANLNGIIVHNGQIVELEIDDDQEVEWDDGILEIEAPSFLLTVSCTDAAGNTGTATATPDLNEEEDD